MPDITLVAETGRPTGSRPTGRLRRTGKVPGVLYGHGMAPIALAVDRRELRHALTGDAGVNAVVQLKVDGTTHPTVVKELQRHPVRHTVTHVDFIVVRMDEEITVDVPIVVEGEPKRVLSEGGVIEHPLATLSVITTPRDIPPHLTVDISGLAIGDVIRVGELTLPRGVTTDVDPDTPVVVAAGAAVELEEEVAEGEEGEAEGAAPSGEGGGETTSSDTE
ncbi:MAG TPA: 50S ribosomal protein L25 [Acidimicrobiales bacterium]|nr:50S ribosomal protein L25 [Acidimicrobiales bacterium]